MIVFLGVLDSAFYVKKRRQVHLQLTLIRSLNLGVKNAQIFDWLLVDLWKVGPKLETQEEQLSRRLQTRMKLTWILNDWCRYRNEIRCCRTICLETSRCFKHEAYSRLLMMRFFSIIFPSAVFCTSVKPYTDPPSRCPSLPMFVRLRTFVYWSS